MDWLVENMKWLFSGVGVVVDPETAAGHHKERGLRAV